MDEMRLLGFIGVTLAGGVLMALVLELLNTERGGAPKQRHTEIEPAVRSVASLPAFFVRPQSDVPAPAMTPLDEALLAFIEEHVRTEQAMATRFVHFPSLDSLYRQEKPLPTMH